MGSGWSCTLWPMIVVADPSTSTTVTAEAGLPPPRVVAAPMQARMTSASQTAAQRGRSVLTCANVDVMKMNATLAKAFSDQITLELASSVVYLQLAIALDDHDLPGMASWMRIQAHEENTHAAKVIHHVTARGNRPQIGAIAAPTDPGDGVLAAFKVSLAHEQRVSDSIRELYRLAQREGDIDSIPLLNWFVEEQVEEESRVEEILGRLRMIGDDGAGLLRLDAELGARQVGVAE